MNVAVAYYAGVLCECTLEEWYMEVAYIVAAVRAALKRITEVDVRVGNTGFARQDDPPSDNDEDEDNNLEHAQSLHVVGSAEKS